MNEKITILTVDGTHVNINFCSTTNHSKIRVITSYLTGVSYER